MRTHFDSASTRRTSPAPERTSSAGGTPRAHHQTAHQAQAVRLGPTTRPHIKRRRYASGPPPDRTSSAGGTPRAHHQTARQAQAVRLGPGGWPPRTAHPSLLIVPHQQADKSPHNQHVVSILHVGAHHLRYRCFRTNKPKTPYKTNTFCSLTYLLRAGGRLADSAFVLVIGCAAPDP